MKFAVEKLGQQRTLLPVCPVGSKAEVTGPVITNDSSVDLATNSVEVKSSSPHDLVTHDVKVEDGNSAAANKISCQVQPQSNDASDYEKKEGNDKTGGSISDA